MTLSTASVTRPSVPSDPTIQLARSHPAEELRGRRRVLTVVLSARTMVREMAQALIVQYRYALVPEQFIAICFAVSTDPSRPSTTDYEPTIPPIFAPGAGSGAEERKDRGLQGGYPELPILHQVAQLHPDPPCEVIISCSSD